MKKNVIIILNYNDFRMCDRLLNHIKLYNCFFKIVIVDNCSTDDSYDRIKEKYADTHIDVIKTDFNGGYAYGNNFGCIYAIKKYDPDVLFIANPDVLFEENVVEKMSAIVGSDSKYGVVAPLVRTGYNIWSQPDYWKTIASLFLILYTIEKKRCRKKVQRANSIQEIGVVEGSFFAIDAEVFRIIGGFDTRTFLYCEEMILGFRLKQAGYRTAVIPNSYYEHLHSQSIGKEYKSKAKAFVNCREGMLLYLNEYLKVNKAQMFGFEIAYRFAYLERKAYDVVLKIINR